MKIHRIIPYFYVGLIFTFISGFLACLVMLITGDRNQPFSDIIAYTLGTTSLILLMLNITNHM